ncbi:MAG: acyl-CoA dehydrogenase domain protein [Chthoniobacteraceae bacterium]|nr:acyl-CoA dehydrogenase domain protein [Chthoniobacteraceae bacterium]
MKTESSPQTGRPAGTMGSDEAHGKVPSADPQSNPGEPEPQSAIDTSRMSPEQRAALELTEAAREGAHAERGLCGGLFMGQFHLEAIQPFPMETAQSRARGEEFLEKLRDYLKAHVDPDEIDRTGEIPEEVFEGLAQLGAFGIKIAPEYGGLGLSQTTYCRAAMLLGSYCANLTALISAHQSIGVPQPLILFGTDEQKRRFLPRVAAGEISAFALTEPKVGSDPARMETHAEPTADGRHFVINGEKLWCTNGVKAGVIAVMARTASKNGRNQITAFLVEMNTPGVEVVRRCHFMGLRALYNAVVRFTDVKVPVENILLAEGKGLRVALTTLNTGRLTLPAACTGMSKRCLRIARKWAAERIQWGTPIGQHAAVADKIARMASETFAMEAMTLFAASIVDRDKHADVRLEAAMCKLWATERSWEHVNEAMQIRGGRGYETAQSLAARGEEPVPVERFFRDSRINTIFEGSSEIMRLFIAREVLDPHLKIGAPVLNTQLSKDVRFKAALRSATFYGTWYPKQWLGALTGSGVRNSEWDRRLATHLRYASRTSHRLARTLFHSMARYGPKLERQQLLLGRFVDIGTELFAIIATCSRAESMGNADAIDVASLFCRRARLRIEQLFEGIAHNADRPGYKVAQQVLNGDCLWLEEGTVNG